jgi:hypothetical protein
VICGLRDVSGNPHRGVTEIARGKKREEVEEDLHQRQLAAGEIRNDGRSLLIPTITGHRAEAKAKLSGKERSGD